jgi:hypothetical protein
VRLSPAELTSSPNLNCAWNACSAWLLAVEIMSAYVNVIGRGLQKIRDLVGMC